jgi:hypothetical protein
VEQYLIFAEGTTRQTFHVHRASDDLCVSQITTWCGDDENVMRRVLQHRITLEIVRFEGTDTRG